MKLSAIILLTALSSLLYAQENHATEESESFEVEAKTSYLTGRSIHPRISGAQKNQHIMHLAADNNASTFWTAERGVNEGPVWIDMDLGADQMISAVLLTPAMYPNGFSSHNIWGRTSSGEWTFITSYSGNTSDNKTIHLEVTNKHKPVRYLVVETTQSPSWVAWRELRAEGRLAVAQGCNEQAPSSEWIQTRSVGDYIMVPRCKEFRENHYIDSDGLPAGYTTIACNADALPYGWIRTEAIKSDQCYYRSSFSGVKTYDQAYRVRKDY